MKTEGKVQHAETDRGNDLGNHSGHRNLRSCAVAIRAVGRLESGGREWRSVGAGEALQRQPFAFTGWKSLHRAQRRMGLLGGIETQWVDRAQSPGPRSRHGKRRYPTGAAYLGDVGQSASVPRNGAG